MVATHVKRILIRYHKADFYPLGWHAVSLRRACNALRAKGKNEPRITLIPRMVEKEKCLGPAALIDCPFIRVISGIRGLLFPNAVRTRSLHG